MPIVDCLGKRIYFLLVDHAVIATCTSWEFDALDLEGRVVLDIGAYVGDTAMLFAVKGAKKVFAVEPDPSFFAIMVENLLLNNLSNVEPINVAITPKRGFARKLPDTSFYGTRFIPANDGDVLGMSLSDLLETYNIEPDFMKINCEGCEEYALRDPAVSSFREILVDVHNWSGLKNLAEVLQNFSCRLIKSADVFSRFHCIKR